MKFIYSNVASSKDGEEGAGNRPGKFKVGSDSLLIGVVNHSSSYMTNGIRHFIGTIKPINNRVSKGCIGVIKVVV